MEKRLRTTDTDQIKNPQDILVNY